MADALASGASDRKVVGVQVPPRARGVPYTTEARTRRAVRHSVDIRTQQTIYAAAASVVFSVVVYRLGRNRKLSFRYTVGWLALGLLGIVAGILIPLTGSIASRLHIAPAAVLGIVGLVLLLVLCVQLSISISGTQEQVRRLTEQVALLRADLEEVASSDTETS